MAGHDLKDLKPLATKLNAESDALTAALQTTQDKLNGLGIGMEVWLQGPLHQFGYGRYGNGWALLVRGSEYGTHKPLLRASRELRIASVKLLPALIDELQRAAKEAAGRIEQARKIAESL